jgi:hypothetical protein
MKLKKQLLSGLMVAGALLFFAGRASAVDINKKQHPSTQLVYSSAAITGATAVYSTTIDLVGGDYDKISAQVLVTSGTSTGTPTLDVAIQVSADGGTNWATAGSFTQITSTAAASVPYNVLKQDLATGPGIKARLRFTGSANTTWNTVKAWVMPNVN